MTTAAQAELVVGNVPERICSSDPGIMPFVVIMMSMVDDVGMGYSLDATEYMIRLAARSGVRILLLTCIREYCFDQDIAG